MRWILTGNVNLDNTAIVCIVPVFRTESRQSLCSDGAYYGRGFFSQPTKREFNTRRARHTAGVHRSIVPRPNAASRGLFVNERFSTTQWSETRRVSDRSYKYHVIIGTHTHYGGWVRRCISFVQRSNWQYWNRTVLASHRKKAFQPSPPKKKPPYRKNGFDFVHHFGRGRLTRNATSKK